MFLHGQGLVKCGQGHHQGQDQRKAQGMPLVDLQRRPAPGQKAVNQFGIIDGGADGHGGDITDGLKADLAFEHQTPLLRPADLLERVIGQGFVGPARGGFGRTAQNPVGQEKDEQQRRVVPWRQAQKDHFGHHQYGGNDQETSATDDIRQGPRGNLQHDDRRRPDGIQQGKLLQGETEVQKENGENGVIKARVEAHAKSNEMPDVGKGQHFPG